MTESHEEEDVALGRATINLPGFPAGSILWIDLRSEYVRNCLAAGYIILEEEPK